jgi:hypothetical protein
MMTVTQREFAASSNIKEAYHGISYRIPNFTRHHSNTGFYNSGDRRKAGQVMLTKGEIMLTRDTIREHFQAFKMGKEHLTTLEFLNDKYEMIRAAKIAAQTEQRRELARKWS